MWGVVQGIALDTSSMQDTSHKNNGTRALKPWKREFKMKPEILPFGIYPKGKYTKMKLRELLFQCG